MTRGGGVVFRFCYAFAGFFPAFASVVHSFARACSRSPNFAHRFVGFYSRRDYAAYDRRQSRLWKFTIGLTYDTPREKIEHLTADLTAMLQAQPDVQPDGVTIALDKFNDYSIDLACRVYITKVNLRDFMRVKDTLNLQILDLMQEEGCEFAFPTTTVDFPERK